MDTDKSKNRSLPLRIHVLAKPTGAACNLDCAYCFFLEKEKFYPGSRFRMSEAVLEAYISQVTKAQTSTASQHCLAGRGTNANGYRLLQAGH
jgi:sulfatase maturation enzyme AslB (radical SAM superfamily)